MSVQTQADVWKWNIWVFPPWFGEVGEVHLSDEAPADAAVVAVLQQHALLPAVRLVTLRPVSAHTQVELHKLRPLRVQVPAHQLPQPSLRATHTHKLQLHTDQELLETLSQLLFKAAFNIQDVWLFFVLQKSLLILE